MFLFKDELLQKHDNVSMRSSLTSTMANFFLSSLENKLLKLDPNFIQSFIYVFSVFNKDKKCFKFFVMFSTEHINIKFTKKHLLETISFLDVEIKINNTVIETWAYRKPTNTNFFKFYCK